MEPEIMSATVTVAAPATRVFEVLADPAIHTSIDGTGWVREPVERAKLTELGQVFRMAMHHRHHPDGDYQTANQVHIFDLPRAIGWRTGHDAGNGELGFGGWFWRYDLVEVGPSETEVTLTYDWSATTQSFRDRIPFPPFGPEYLTSSLQHLAELAAPAPPPETAD